MIEMINRQKNEGIVVERCQPKVDVVFLLDSNNSNDNIDKIYIEHVRWAISLMESLPLEHDAIRVAAAKYLGFPLTEFSLGEDIRQKLQFQQTFRTGYALRKAESELFRQDRETRKDAAKVIIIFTNNPNIFNEIMLEHKLNEIKDFKIFIASIIDIKTNNSNFDENNVFSQKELPQLRESILTEAERARACSRIGDEAFNGQRRNGPSTNQQNIGKISNGGAFALAENRDRLNNNIGESNDNNFGAEAFLQQRRIEAAEMLGIDEEGNEEINKLNKNEEEKEEEKNFGKSFEVKGNENTQIEEEFNNKMSQNSKQDEQDISIDGEQALLFNNAAAFKIPSLINADELDVFDPLENSKPNSQIRRPFTGVTINSITTPSFPISRYRPILGLSSFTKKPPSSSSFLTTQKYNNYTTTTTLATTTNKLPKTFPVKVELPVAIAQRLRPTPSIEFFFEFNNEGEQQNKQLLKSNSMLEMINKIKKINREEAEKSKKEEVNNLKNNFRLNKFTKTTNQPITTTTPKILFTTKILKNLIPNKNLTETTKTTQKYKILPTTTKTTTEFYTIQQPPTTKNNYLISVQQKPKTFGITQQRVVCPPLDILFIVDSSGSVHKIYEAQKEWLQHLLENIELNDDLNEEINNKINLNQLCGHRVALIQFASSDLQKIEWEWDHFRKNWQMMENFHKNVRHITGTTYIGQALKQALKLLEERRRQVPIIVVLLSDGFSQDDAIKQAEAIRNLPNLQFYALSIGQLSNIELLHRLVDNPSHVFIGNEASELLRSQLLRRIRCNQ
uniref:VWFA domain-containing protein n=1 Tax=Meloidogyne enterolobii TaxID=390850 RepID=A0A6V7W4F5_MELEN|nr:unnamed protein product [Meloidogyne enterolobii]